jgi:FecR protein
MPQHSRTAFSRWISLALVAALVLTLRNAPVTGQRQENFEGFMRGIRANAVEGKVLFQRNDAKFDLETGLKLEEGDFIKNVDGFTELLLQPGNYLRIGSETEFQIFSEQYDKMRLKVNEGTISLEILARDIPRFNSTEQVNELIRVITPNAEVFISEPGIFRINVTDGGRTEVISRDGEALINGRHVKEKRRAVAANGNVSITEIDSKIEDKFDVWGRERSAKLIQANKLLKNQPPWSNRKKGEETSVEWPDEKEETYRGLVISAKPGAVNFTETGVEFSRAQAEWQQLTEKSQLEAGDTLRTSAHSFAELMLFPDMHLRLDRSSEVLFDQLSNDSISIKVLRGSAILDVARFDQKQLPQIKVAGPSSSVAIASDGHYRIDVSGSGEAITIRDGKVIFNERPVSACRKIAAGVVAECDKKQYDNFDFWSEYRGEGEVYNGRETVARATHLAKLRRLRFRNTGFWFQQPGQTTYTFVPFSSRLFRSPYGGSYSTVLSPRPMLNRVILGRNP